MPGVGFNQKLYFRSILDPPGDPNWNTGSYAIYRIVWITVPVWLESWLEYNPENWNFYLIKNGKNSNTIPLEKGKK